MKATLRSRLLPPKLVADERGLSTVEYVVILVLIVALAVGTWHAFGQNVLCALSAANAEYAANVTLDQATGTAKNGACPPLSSGGGTNSGGTTQPTQKVKKPKPGS